MEIKFYESQKSEYANFLLFTKFEFLFLKTGNTKFVFNFKKYA